MSIEQMWHMVSTADMESLGKVDTGWKRASELAYLHKSRLESYKEHLLKIWPTQKSTAAQAYVAKLDELIAAVQNSAEVASANQRASYEIRTAMYEARGKVKKIYDRYKALPTPTDSSEGQNFAAQNNAMATEARGVMNTLANALGTAQRTFVQPKPYVPPAPGTGYRGDGDYGSGGSGPSGLVLPLIPVPQVTPTPPQFVGTPTGPLTPMPITTGPDLSGLNPTTTLPGPSTLPTGTIGSGPPSTSIGLGTTGLIGGAGMVNPTTGAAGLGKTMPQGIIGGAQGAAGARTAGAVGGLRANPPGGLIGGGVPPRGGPGSAAIAGRPGLGAMGGRAGMANAHGAFGTMAGGPGTTGRAGGMLPTAMGGRPGQRGEHDGQDYDPDTEWSVAQGVSPVVDSPLADAPVNPGPAIGLDR
jgi:hypothetical protein